MMGACNISIAFLLCICLTVGLFVLGTYNVLKGNAAIENMDCNSAMSDTTGGINSPSANLGTPLLAIVAIVNGAVHLFVAAMVTIVCIVFVVISCDILARSRWSTQT
jgi:hypothetical protein